MTVNVTDLRTKLSTRLQALTGAEDSEDVLALTVALTNLTSNRFMSVTKYDDLPNLTTFPMPSGTLVYVEQLNVMMMSIGTQWKGIEGRTYVPRYIAYAWGYNSFGRLGDNSSTNRSSPVTVVGGVAVWKQLAGGYRHSLGVTTTGIAYAWGYNNLGQLGDGTTATKSSPVSVIGGITNWSQVSAGNYQSIGITTTGIAYGWGRNDIGQIGDGTTVAKSSPVSIVGGITTWSQVSAGFFHGLGLTSGGIAYAWGYNNSGRLGDGTTTSRLSPVTVIGGITNWNVISAAGSHSLGITTSGIAYAWGPNGSGRLGDNTQTARSSPVTVVGGITTWSKVSGGQQHSVGLTTGGIAYAWGYNASGRLGDNTTVAKSSPVTVVGGITTWSQIVSGQEHNIALTSAGILYGWGLNSQGRIGDGTLTNRSSPVSVIGGFTTWNQISASNHSLGIIVV